MTIEELYDKLEILLKELPDSGFEGTSDSLITELNSLSGEAETLGMKNGKQLAVNLAETLKTRKAGGNTDENVRLRLTALDFYIKKLQTGATEDL